MRNCIQILSLRDTAVIDKVIGATNHLITRVTCLNETLCHIAHIHDRHDILARANDKTLTRLDQRDKAAKTRRIAWSIDPAWTDNYYGSTIIFHQVGNQFLTRDLRTAIWIVLAMKWTILGHNTMQMMSIDRI